VGSSSELYQEWQVYLLPKGLPESGSEGVVVTEVDPDGVVSEHGLKSGDIILEVGGSKVASVVRFLGSQVVA
jgi:S1-C subfamily serine protease